MRQKPTPVQNTVLHSSVGKSTVGNLKPCKSMQHPRKRPSMTNEDTKTYFLHYPKLVVPTQGIDLLGGRLEQFGFADFKSLDRDWAHDFMFRKTKPAIWRRVLSDSELPPMIDTANTSELDPDDGNDIGWDYIDGLGTLIYYALLIEVGELYPYPRMSVRYLRSKNTGVRIQNLESRRRPRTNGSNRPSSSSRALLQDSDTPPLFLSSRSLDTE